MPRVLQKREHALSVPCISDSSQALRERCRARRPFVWQNASRVSADCRASLVLSSDGTAVRAFERQVTGRSRPARCIWRVNGGGTPDAFGALTRHEIQSLGGGRSP